MSTQRRCRLQLADGHIEDCPEDRCAFWDAAGATPEGRCAVEHVDLSGNPELVSWLLSLRARLESAASDR